jgi:hypothetical protein
LTLTEINRFIEVTFTFFLPFIEQKDQALSKSLLLPQMHLTLKINMMQHKVWRPH